MNNIYIFTSAISRKNGGNSSIVDLANGMVELNYKVNVFTYFGFMDKYIYKPTAVSNKLKIKVLKNKIYKLKNPPIKKYLLNKILNLLYIFDNMSLKNSIIIDAIGLPDKVIQDLKSNNCKIIFNHAGSCDAMIKYFGTNGVKKNNLDKSKQEYLEMINCYDYILFQSLSQAKELFKLAKWKKNKTIVLRPSVSMKDIDNIKNKNCIFDENIFNVVIVGSVQERKGQHLLPKIYKILDESVKNIKFHIVGNIVNYDYKDKIEKEITKFGQNGKIIFHGFKSNYLEYISNADIILQVSEEEGVSRILREAMCLKKMIISFRLNGTNDLLEDGKDCLLSDYNDLESIANNILKVYNDRDLLSTYALKAFENFEKKYSKKEYLKQLKNIIKELN